MSYLFYSVPMPAPDVLANLETIYHGAEQHLEKATFKTGSISLASMAYLHNLCEQFHPLTMVEVGTYIGRSTRVLASFGYVWTCDMSNACFPESERVTYFPHTTSTQMLGQLADHGVKADFFFFDGRLYASDVALILRLSQWNTVYAFDDYELRSTDPKFATGKGIANVDLLEPFLKDYTLIEPPDRVADLGTTTIAVLVPKELV